MKNVKENHNIKLIIAGEFYEPEKKYDELIESLDVADKIIKVNKYIPNDDVPKYFCASELIVLPYKTATQSGVVPIALHFNKNIIVTDVGSLSKLIQKHNIGYIAETDPRSIAEQINAYFDKPDLLNHNFSDIKQELSWQGFFDTFTSELLLKQSIEEHISCIKAILDSNSSLYSIQASTDLIVDAYKKNHKVLFCGNGGSAADSEHLAAELSGRFKLDRNALNADALHTSGSALTAISNDYSYDDAYARLLQAKGQQGDILIAISTSGTSTNVVRAIAKAKSLNMGIITISGHGQKDFHQSSDVSIIIPSTDTARIQEAYMLLGHIICEQVEQKLFS